MKNNGMDRRDFLKAAAGFFIAGCTSATRVSAEEHARVILVRSAEALRPTGEVNGPVVKAMLDARPCRQSPHNMMRRARGGDLCRSRTWSA